MGRVLYEREPAARAVFDHADGLLGYPLSRLCFDGPVERLTDTANQQPALFVTSLAAWEVIRRREEWPEAAYMAGHSLGEFSALVAAGSLDFAAGLELVRRRGEVMQQAGEAQPGGMAAILGLDVATLETLCSRAHEQVGRPVQVANDNCPGQVVISGDRRALDVAVQLAEQAGARKVVRLPITIAAHSPLMASAATAFSEVVEAAPVVSPAVPVIGNVTARPLTWPGAIRSELRSQLTGSVQWASSMRYLRDQGVATFVEVGPGDVLTGLMKRIDRKAERLRFTEVDAPDAG